MSDITMDQISEPEERWCASNATAFASSDQFFRIYDQSMTLIRKAADYLELKGVMDRHALSQHMGAIYACESMRLTTRLMQISAWLLAMRAVRHGEITPGDIETRGFRLGAKDVCLAGPVRGAGLLPVGLIDMLGASRRLYEQMLRLDHLLFEHRQPAHNTVVAQISRIEQAFCV